MAEKATFSGAPDGDSPEPFKYYATFTDKHGVAGAETVVMSADPAADDRLSDQEAADAVKRHLIKTRGDYFNRGITWDKLTVVKGPRQTKEDRAKVQEIIASLPPVEVTPEGKVVGGAKVQK